MATQPAEAGQFAQRVFNAFRVAISEQSQDPRLAVRIAAADLRCVPTMVDQPVFDRYRAFGAGTQALLEDLKKRGLLDELNVRKALAAALNWENFEAADWLLGEDEFDELFLRDLLYPDPPEPGLNLTRAVTQWLDARFGNAPHRDDVEWFEDVMIYYARALPFRPEGLEWLIERYHGDLESVKENVHVRLIGFLVIYGSPEALKWLAGCRYLSQIFGCRDEVLQRYTEVLTDKIRMLTTAPPPPDSEKRKEWEAALKDVWAKVKLLLDEDAEVGEWFDDQLTGDEWLRVVELLSGR